MPHEIETSTRRKVVKLWIQGFTYAEIAEKVGVSYNSVRNIVGELRAGRYPEFASFRDQLEQLRWLNQQLRSNNRSLPQAVIGLEVFNALAETGIDPRKISESLRLLKRLSPPDFPVKTFLLAGLRVLQLEEKTGTRFEHLQIQYEHLITDVRELEKSKKSLEEDKTMAERQVQKILNENAATIEILGQYSKDRRTLHEAGLGLPDIRTASEFIRKAKTEGALNAAIELFDLESKTGKHSSTLLAEYRQAITLKEEYKSEAREYEKSIGRSKLEIAKLREEEERQLVTNKVTREELNKHAAIQKRLSDHGVSFEKLEKFSTVVQEIEEYGWQAASIIDQIQEIGNLETRIQETKSRLTVVCNKLREQKDVLESLDNSIARKTTTLKLLQKAEADCEDKLARLRQTTVDEEFRSELSRGLFLILTDPSKTTDLQLGNLATKLRDIMRARREAHGLPIDYEQLRQETIVTMEYALGKKLIPKETADSQAGLIHEKYQELLLNRVSKIANEKLRLQKRETDLKKNEADLESRKDELALAKAEFQNASNEKLLTLALGQFRSGLINVFTCQNCGCIFAYQLGKKGSATYRMICPCCLVGPVRQRNKWPNEKVTVSS